MRTPNGYTTRQRTEIENILRENSNTHLTAEDIIGMLLQKNKGIGKTTVYRTLQKLVNDGKVRKFTADKSDSACFQYINNTGHCHEHFHLKCTDCGQLLHLDCQRAEQLTSHISAEHGFLLNTGRTILYGTCAKCQMKG